MDFSKLIFLLVCGVFSSTANPISNASGLNSLPGFKNSTYRRILLQKAKAAEMKAYMDESIDPCTDFYKFSCGNWKRINKARTVPTTGFFEELSKGFARKAAKIINDTADPNDTEVDKAVKRFYQSCVKLHNTPLKEHQKELKAIIEEYGSMPVLVEDEWDDHEFDWIATVAKIEHDLGIQIMFGSDIMADFKDNRKNRIYFGQTQLMLESKSMYMDESNEVYRKLYVSKIRDSLRKYLDLPREMAALTAREILDFEIGMAKGLADDHVSQSLDESTILTNCVDMNQKYSPTINVRRYLKIMFGKEILQPFYEYQEMFQKNLKNLIENTPKRKLANYIFYKLVSKFFPKINEEKKEQEHDCQGIVSQHFAKNVDNMIYRRHNNNGTENDVNTVWHEIKNAFRRELNSDHLNWISLETRASAMKKLNAMRLEINSYASTDFKRDFGNLSIDDMNYISNLKNIFRHNANKTISKLNQDPEPFEASEDLSYTPANVILENKIKIPVSLLQPNYLWGDYYPTALKFGTLGFLIGHELIHGFDDAGREYDENGNQRDWWDELSKEAFIERTQCFMMQYHEYIFGEKQLPLSEAQSENIADNGGLKIAYDAYLKWLDEEKLMGNDLSGETLPDMNYTNKQLFFISYGQVWCSDTHPAMMQLQTATDEHTPGIYRVIGVLSNFEEFAKEFQCPQDSHMRQKTRCEIY